MSEIKGYTKPTEEQIALVNEFKDAEKQLGELYQKARASGLADPRMLSIGKTTAQEAFMWLNRSIFKPADVFETTGE